MLNVLDEFTPRRPPPAIVGDGRQSVAFDYPGPAHGGRLRKLVVAQVP